MARLGAAIRSAHPELGDLTPELLAATGRGAAASAAGRAAAAVAAAGPPPDTGDADATVSVLRGAFIAGERVIHESDLDPQFADDLILALRDRRVPELIASLVENRRRGRRGSGS
jgi:hypothetical protein